jgi:hypothetical protein
MYKHYELLQMGVKCFVEETYSKRVNKKIKA